MGRGWWWGGGPLCDGAVGRCVMGQWAVGGGGAVALGSAVPPYNAGIIN